MVKKTVSIFMMLIIFPLSLTISASPVDVSRRFSGHNEAYYVEFNNEWRRHILIEREVLLPGSIEREKLNFFYVPISRNSEKVFLMSIFVYSRRDWYGSIGFRRITETSDYVLALYSNHRNPFPRNTIDWFLFGTFMNQARDVNFVNNMISFPEVLPDNSRNVITVNGKILSNPSLQVGNTYMLPIREIATELGFAVSWNPTTTEIRVSRAGVFSTSVTFDDSVPRNYTILNKGGITYVSSAFFIRNFRVSIEVDERGNVNIRG